MRNNDCAIIVQLGVKDNYVVIFNICNVFLKMTLARPS